MKKVKKNSVVVVRHILGETAIPLVEELGGGKYRFKVEAWCEGETCKGGFFHLRQAIEAKPGKAITNTVNFWPRLRAALHNAGVLPVNIPGGDYPLHYADQIAIPDYSMSGAHYFIIERADIGKYLDAFPLDERGIKHREEIEERRRAAEAEAYRQEHDPQCIAKRIGDALWLKKKYLGENIEFVRITLRTNKDDVSVIYPAQNTDLAHCRCYTVAKVICSAPETGFQYLDAKAAYIDTRQHYRIKKQWSSGWARDTAYLMPLPTLATEVREHPRWLALFDTFGNNDDIDPNLIAEASRVIMETFDLYDRLNKKRLVYEASTKEVHVEFLHNDEWEEEE